MRTSKLFTTLTVGLLLIPSITLAEGDNTGARPIETPVQTRETPTPHATPSPRPSASPEAGQFCIDLNGTSSQIGSNTDSHFSQLKTNFGQGADKVKSDMAGVGQSLAVARSTSDTKRKSDFTALSAKATTDAQKQAIATFETSVTAAITAQRAAVDAADAVFEKGILTTVTDRQAKLAAAATAYKTAVAAALAAAQASCTAGVTPSTVRTTLQTNLQAARNQLQALQRSADKLGPNTSALEVARKASVDQAEATCKLAIQQALATLKAALGSAASSPSPSASPQG